MPTTPPPAPRAARPPLTRDSWTDAALAALLEHGPGAVAVQPLADALGATKGSFYWHFSSRDELLESALHRWRDRTLRLIDEIDALAATESPADRLRALLETVTGGVAEPPGEQRILAGIDDPVVRAVVAEVTGRRMEYVHRLLMMAGVQPGEEAGRRAFHGYVWFLGYGQLATILPDTVRRDQEALLDDVLRLMLPDP